MIYYAIAIAVVGLLATGIAVREVNMKTSESHIETDLQRSHEYETSVKNNWSRLTKVYLITFSFMFIIWMIYLFFE